MNREERLQQLVRSGGRQTAFSDFYYFLKENKRWWLIPFILTLLVVGLVVLLSGTGAAPFVYTFF